MIALRKLAQASWHLKPAAIILDNQVQMSFDVRYLHGNLGRLGVLERVAQRLLGYPKNADGKRL